MALNRIVFNLIQVIIAKCSPPLLKSSVMEEQLQS
jgi:hypothetical protein